MATPGIGTPIIYHVGGTVPFDAVGWVVLTHDTWTSAIGTANGWSQPASDEVNLAYFDVTEAAYTSAVNVSEGTGDGEFSLLPMAARDA